MPNLGDYLGLLLCEVTQARMQADLESVRIAELYASHPLLRHMPVPHFRLPDVHLDVPVVIKQMDEVAAGTLPRGAPSTADLRKAFDSLLPTWLSREGIRFTPAASKRLSSALDRAAESLSASVETAVDVRSVADAFSEVVLRSLTTQGGPLADADADRLVHLDRSVRDTTRTEFLKLRKPPSRLQVLVTTPEVREAGPPETITRLQLKLTEEAFEWTTIESGGREHDRLVPE